MNNKFKILIMLCLALSMLFVSCAERGPGDDLIEREDEEDFVPTSDADVDEELLQKYQTHKENAPLAFKSYSANSAADFEYTAEGDAVTIDKYIGTADIVVIPDKIDGKSVTKLSATSFAGLAVRAVYVPDSVKVIEKGAFESAKSLATLRVPFVGNGEGDRNGGVIFGADDYISNGLKVPGSLKMLIIGEGESEIVSDGLSYFKSLEAVILPQSLEKIGQFAFNECHSLVYVDFGGVRHIEEYAFLSCESLISLELPVSCETIGLGAFMQCDSLKYMSLHFVGGSKSENQYIGYIFGAENRAWNNNFMPVSLSYITLDCEKIPDMALEGCINLIEVTLENGVKEIGERAFSNCRSMQGIIFADSVEKISADAFINCYTLEKIEFSSNSRLNEIGMQAFMNCTSLTSVKLPSGVTSLPTGTFSGCARLESIAGVNITSVGSGAFYACDGLKAAVGISKSGVDPTGNSKLADILN